MQTKFSKISNIIFKYFLIFAISFLWLDFYIRNLLVVGLISIIISIILGQLITLLNKKRKNIIELNQKENKKMQDISLTLLLANKKDLLRFFNIMLNINHSAELKDDAIIWEDSIFIPFYEKQLIDSDDIAKIFKNSTQKNIYVSGIEFTADALNLADKILDKNIYLINEQQIFSLMKQYDLYPDFEIKTKSKEKFKYSKLKEIAFTKQNAKHYLLSGILILITSFFIRYNFYYLVFATLLFIFSGISFFKSTPDTTKLDI